MSRKPEDSGAPVVGAPAVAVAIADFLVRTETERLRLFWMHLHATVTKTSALLLELAALEGVSLEDAVTLMHPPVDWPWHPLRNPVPPVMRTWSAIRLPLGSEPTRGAGRFRRAFANPGIIIRGVDHPRGRFAIRPCDQVLGFTAAIGPCLVSAFGPVVAFKFPEPLPETLTMSLPGRKLDGIVDHPLFRGRGYVVQRVFADPTDDLTILVFKAPLAPFRIPLPTLGERTA